MSKSICFFIHSNTHSFFHLFILHFDLIFLHLVPIERCCHGVVWDVRDDSECAFDDDILPRAFDDDILAQAFQLFYCHNCHRSSIGMSRNGTRLPGKETHCWGSKQVISCHVKAYMIFHSFIHSPFRSDISTPSTNWTLLPWGPLWGGNSVC